MDDLGDIGTLGADPDTFDPSASIVLEDDEDLSMPAMEDLGEVSLEETEITEVFAEHSPAITDEGEGDDFDFPEEEDQGLALPDDSDLGKLELSEDDLSSPESDDRTIVDSDSQLEDAVSLDESDDLGDLGDFSLEEESSEDGLIDSGLEEDSAGEDLSDFSMDETQNLELDEDLEMDSLSLEDDEDFSTEDTDELTESLSIDDGLGDVDLSPAEEDSSLDLPSIEDEEGDFGPLAAADDGGLDDDLEPLDLESDGSDLSLDEDLSMDLDLEEETAMSLDEGDDALDYSVEDPVVDPLSLNNIPEPKVEQPAAPVAPDQVKKISDDMTPKEKTFVVLMIASLVMAFSILVALLLLHFIGTPGLQPEVLETPAYLTPRNVNEGSYDLSSSNPGDQSFPADDFQNNFTLRGELTLREGTWESDRERMESGSFFSGS
jgi:hypothetical protein